MESQGLEFDVAEAAQEGLVLAMVEQLEKNTTSFLQEEHASDSSIGQEGTPSMGNVNVLIHFPNVIEEFQSLIEELKN